MKSVFLAALVFLFTFNVTSQPNHSPAKREQSAEPKGPPRLSLPNNNITTNDAEHSKDNAPKWYAALERPDWWLVIIAFLTGAAVAYQAREMRDATDVMRRQLGAMQSQLGQMESSGKQTDELIIQAKAQVKELHDATDIALAHAEAAADSAKAAQENIALFVSKERARLVMEEPIPIRFTTSQPVIITYGISYYGSTPAFAVESEINAIIHQSEESPINNLMTEKIELPNVIPSAQALTPRYQTIVFNMGDSFAMNLQQPIVDALMSEKMFVHMWGYIKYKDFMGDPHATTFRFRWKIDQPNRVPHWEKYGRPEDNQET